MDEANFHRLIAVVAFAGTYLGLALGRLPFLRVDRTGVAIIGAALVVVSGVLPWDIAVAAVDAHTIVLLFGMMIVAAYLRLSGFFRLVTYAAVRRAHTPVGLLALIVAAAGILSALFVNDVVCLVMAPIVLDLTRQLRLPAQPYLIGLATAANVGSVATLTGNPQNMLVGSFSGIGYRTFLLREAPVAVVGLLLVFAVIWLAYRRRLPEALPALDLEERFVVHRALMTKTIVAVSVMLVAFLAGVPIALVAIAGAACCLLTRRVNPDKVYREIDWGLLVLFAGLFVVIAGVEASGLTDVLLGWASAIGLYRPVVLTAITAVLSNLVSNVPAVLLFKTLIPTILGSVANLIVVEHARGAGIRIGFVEHGTIGVPVTVLTLIAGWLLLII